MRTVERFITYDGVEHKTRNEANSHLDRKYSSLITRVSDGLRGRKPALIATYLDEHLDVFEVLLAIRKDRQAPKEEDD